MLEIDDKIRKKDFKISIIKRKTEKELKSLIDLEHQYSGKILLDFSAMISTRYLERYSRD